MDEPDPRVIRAAAAGDEQAFTALMRSTQPHVWRFVRHLLGDEEQAADVTQETFIRVHRALGRFRFEARFSTWLFHIARNAAVDEQRRSGRRLRLAAAITRPEATSDSSLGAELQAALATLSPRLREAFVVVEVFGLRYQDAADVIGTPIGTVKSRVFRARLELVRWFDEDLDSAGAAMVERDLDQLRRISEALDGEGPMPHPLDPEGEAFLGAALRLRSQARLEEAVVPPDVTDAVLHRVRTSAAATAARPRMPLALVAAAVFIVAALTTAALMRAGGPLAPETVLADVGDDVLEAQAGVLALDAEITLEEHGAHPDLPVRRYEGTLRYRAPEQLWLHLEELAAPPEGWPANDVDLVVDGPVAWSSGLRDCPVGQQPGCLRADTRIVTGAAPFSADHVAPLDLLVPAGAFLPSADVSTSAVAGAIVLDTTVARVQQAIDGLRAGGALRSVHPTDRVRVELDDDTFTIRRLTVFAADAPSRVTWAATNGYVERAGAEILDLRVQVGDLPDSDFPDLPVGPGRAAGFDDRSDSEAPVPGYLPPGYTAHRQGILVTSGPDLAVRSWSNGRAWIRLDATDDPTGDTLLGGIGAIARQLPIGEGVGYTDPAGRIVSLHTDGLELTLTGSVPLDTLVRVAASLPLRGAALPDGWVQGDALDELPDGALRVDGPLTARYDGDDLVVAVPGPGLTSAVLRQRPGTRLAPPAPEVVTAPVRGVGGRYDPVTSRLEWVEDGWVRELQSAGLDLEALQVLAGQLESA